MHGAGADLRRHLAGEGTTPWVVPLAKDVWPEFLDLFGGKNGGCGGCWCTWWWMSRAEWYRHTKAQRRAMFKRRVTSGAPTGVLLLNDEEAEGWCAVAPMSSYPTLVRSRVAYPIDAATSWCISCIFIKAPYRRQGRMKMLIREAAAYAFLKGAPAVDGFPQAGNREVGYMDRFVGVESSFLAAGFRRIEKRGENRVAVRKERETDLPPHSENQY